MSIFRQLLATFGRFLAPVQLVYGLIQFCLSLKGGGCTELMILRSVMNYSPEKNSWKVSGVKACAKAVVLQKNERCYMCDFGFLTLFASHSFDSLKFKFRLVE